MEAFVEVISADGTSERYPLEGQQVTLGRSGTAGVSLPLASHLELEHLLLAPRGRQGCWISTSQTATTPTLHKGKPFASGMVPWGAELVIGELRIRVTDRRAPAKRDGKQGSPVVIFGGAAIVAVVAWMYLGETEVDLSSPEGVEPPALFAEQPECPSGDAAANARDAEYRADSRGDRYYFDPRDGVEAVRLYGEAAVCYEQAGQAERATQMNQLREEMEVTVNADYAGRRLRLHHAISTKDWGKAIVETSALVELTQHLSEEDPYVQWLERAKRVVVAQQERERMEAQRRQDG